MSSHKKLPLTQLQHIKNGRTPDQVIEELRESSRKHSRQIIPFIGAGASEILGLPSWKTLVSDYAKLVGFTGNIESLHISHDRSWAMVSEDIFNFSADAIGRPDAIAQYLKYMSGIVVAKNAHFQPLHLTLLKNCQRIITTNYDRAFEEAKKRELPSRDLRVLWFANTLTAAEFHNGSIAHIHGHVDGGEFVFRQAEYDYAYNSSRKRILEFMSSVVQNNHLLFIGFSFDDSIFRKMLETVIDDWKNDIKQRETVYGESQTELPKMYIFLPEKALKTTLKKAELEVYGIPDVQLEKYFKLNEEDEYEMLSLPEIEKEMFFTDPFKKIYFSTQFNRIRLEYLTSLKFGFIFYKDDFYTEIDDRVTQIYKPHSRPSTELPDK